MTLFDIMDVVMKWRVWLVVKWIFGVVFLAATLYIIIGNYNCQEFNSRLIHSASQLPHMLGRTWR